MTIPLGVTNRQCVFVQGVDANGNPSLYGYKYPMPAGYPVGSAIDHTNCEIVGVSPAGATAGLPVEYVTEGMFQSGGGLTPGAPVYCDDLGQISATPGTRTIRMGHAIDAAWAYIRPQNAE